MMKSSNDYNRQINLGAAAGTIGVVILIIVGVALLWIGTSSPHLAGFIFMIMYLSPAVLIPLGLFWMIRDGLRNSR